MSDLLQTSKRLRSRLPRVPVAGAAIALLVAVLWMAWPEGNDLLILKLPNNMQLEMVLIPAGEFMMGSPESEEGRRSHEGPQHRVRISQPFYMGKYEVTQAQWKAVMGENPSSFDDCGSDCPVESVNWDDCQKFCRKLSSITEREIRLPSEAEWEYACRARTTTPFCFGKAISTAQANYTRKPFQTTAVGSFPANAFGLHDMHGNVNEWCEDVYHDSYAGAPYDGSAWITGGRCPENR